MKTVKELAQVLGVSSRTIYRLIDSNKLAAVNVGVGVRRSLRIPPDSFYLFLDNQEKGFLCRERRG